MEVTAVHVAMVRKTVRRIVWKIRRRYLFEDLFSAGLEGLVKAARAFQPTKGVQFQTYAAHRIRGAILDHLRSIDPAGRHARIRARAGDKAKVEWLNNLKVIAGQAAERILLDIPVPPAQETDLDLARLRTEISRAMEELTEKEHYVVRRWFLEGATLATIGDELGVTESRACQLGSAAVSRLRSALRFGSEPV